VAKNSAEAFKNDINSLPTPHPNHRLTDEEKVLYLDGFESFYCPYISSQIENSTTWLCGCSGVITDNSCLRETTTNVSTISMTTTISTNYCTPPGAPASSTVPVVTSASLTAYSDENPDLLKADLVAAGVPQADAIDAESFTTVIDETIITTPSPTGAPTVEPEQSRDGKTIAIGVGSMFGVVILLVVLWKVLIKKGD